MKKVIFICLLTLSVCFSQSQDTNSKEKNKVPDNLKNDTTAITQKPAPQIDNKDANNTDNDKKKDEHPNAASSKTNDNATGLTPSSTTAAVINPVTNSTEKSTTPTTKSTVPNSKLSTPIPSPKTPATNTNLTTPSPSGKPTEKPKEGDKIVQARGFDGPSFIGGIILTVGLLAIGFMGFKYYKNQTERNYHTL